MREDVELLRMAAFKLKEAAGRLKGLARQAKSPRAKTRLEAAAAKLVDWERDLWVALDQGAEEQPPPVKRGDGQPPPAKHTESQPARTRRGDGQPPPTKRGARTKR